MIDFNTKCADCGTEIKSGVASYSFHAYGRELCFACQEAEKSKLKGYGVTNSGGLNGHRGGLGGLIDN